jgi:4-hydroxy-2-oxoheptanedioate aldolase
MIGSDQPRRFWHVLGAALIATLIFLPAVTPAQQPWLHLNPVVEKLIEGKTVFGVSTSDLSIQNARSLAQDDNIDYVYIDMEHNPMRFEQLEMFMAFLIDKAGIVKRGNAQAHPAVFARFAPYSREEELWVIKHGLDLGLMGILANNMETRAQAEHVVAEMRPMQKRDSKIPNPPGLRGTLGGSWFWGMSGDAYRARTDLWPLNPQGDLIFWPMIETKEGVANADAIAQVPGVSGFYLGAAGDLTSSYGAPNNQDADVTGAMLQIMRVCKTRNIPCGGTVSAANVAQKINDGYKIINFGGANGGITAENDAARKGALAAGAKR